jgi:hypothetical protein
LPENDEVKKFLDIRSPAKGIDGIPTAELVDIVKNHIVVGRKFQINLVIAAAANLGSTTLNNKKIGFKFVDDGGQKIPVVFLDQPEGQEDGALVPFFGGNLFLRSQIIHFIGGVILN